MDEKDGKIAALTTDLAAKETKITELTPLAADGKAFRDKLVTDYVTSKAKLGEVAETPEAQDQVRVVVATYPIFFIVERRDPERAAEDVITLVTERIPQRFSLDPKRDIQVLTPMHRGPVGTLALNQRLQSALNPGGPTLNVRGQAFRVGDKVMQTHNDYDKETFNGDIGQVTSLSEQPRRLCVDFDDRIVVFEDEAIESLVLAYATSIHKSQGSEYPAVVIPILTSHFVMLSRNLLYTAVTRAKRLCVLVADPKALRIALAEDRREERQTQLVERLIAGISGKTA